MILLWLLISLCIKSPPWIEIPFSFNIMRWKIRSRRKKLAINSTKDERLNKKVDFYLEFSTFSHSQRIECHKNLENANSLTPSNVQTHTRMEKGRTEVESDLFSILKQHSDGWMEFQLFISLFNYPTTTLQKIFLRSRVVCAASCKLTMTMVCGCMLLCVRESYLLLEFFLFCI